MGCGSQRSGGTSGSGSKDYLHSHGGTTGRSDTPLAPDDPKAGPRRKDTSRTSGEPRESEPTRATRRRHGDAAGERAERERFDAWLAELPPQIRRACETESWDEIPAKWRELLREWTRKMAEQDDESGR